MNLGGFSMKRLALLSLVLVALFGLGFALFARPAVAQDEMMEGVACDSTLITLLYVAEYEYGFHSMMDTSTFAKGQYEPLFEAMMMEMEEGMGDEMMESTEEAMMESTEEVMMEEPMMDEMMLPVGTVAGEDPACTALREELDAFFYETLNEMMMAEEGM
jgi:hypothetical protein